MTMPNFWKTALPSAALVMGAVVGTAAFADEVRVIYPFYSSATGEFFQSAADDFMAENPDITIVLEEVNWDGLQQRLINDVSAGTQADIAVTATVWLPDFVEAEALEPLDDYMTDDFRARFIPSFLEPANYDGQYYGLPFAASARALYFNTDLLEQAGVEAPKTWDELAEVAKAVAALDESIFGFGVQGAEVDTDVYFYYALWAFGGDILNEDGTSGIATEAGIKAAEFYKGLIDANATQPGVTSYTRENLQDLFKQGRLGMMITGPWLNGQIKTESPDLNYGVSLIPTAETTATMGVTDTIAMFADSDNKDEAWMFMDYIFEAKRRAGFTISEGMLPVVASVGDDPHFTDDPRMEAFVEALPTAKFAPLTAGWSEAQDATISALQDIYLGNTDAATALGQAAEDANAALSR